ncbi:MAG: hypothetical protein ACKPKO_10070, partial [Candidatus Fonsibacter sp.]
QLRRTSNEAHTENTTGILVQSCICVGTPCLLSFPMSMIQIPRPTTDSVQSSHQLPHTPSNANIGKYCQPDWCLAKLMHRTSGHPSTYITCNTTAVTGS